MKALGRLTLEVIVLCGIGLGLGLGANAIRADNSLTLGRNYFATVKLKEASVTAQEDAQPTAPTPTEPAVAPEPNRTAEPKPTVAPEPGRAAEPASTSDDASTPTAKNDFGVNVVKLEQVREWFEDPGAEIGLTLFVDARNAEEFREGHIPGAVLLDHYRSEQYLPRVLPLAEDAERVILYCNGGDCEDSLFASRDLLDAGIPLDCIYVYHGGWEEWEKEELPFETGDAE